MLRKEVRDKIVAQALQEIQFARQYKQGKISGWQKNEDLYYGKKAKAEESRANVDLGRMQEFVHTLLSKIDNPLVFKFSKRKNAQARRVERLNSLRQFDAQRDFWDLKDIAGKKQAIMYGRAIYCYYADSDPVYKSHLENVDVYDFLIDPSAGGIDMENAQYLGRYGVVKTREELRQGIGKKNNGYIKDEVNALIEGQSNATESSQEETNKHNRTYATKVTNYQKEKSGSDKFKFWQWYTTYNGIRYYLLVTESGGRAIKVEPLADIFPATEEFPLGPYPFWSFAAFPDLTEFWSPSYCDYVREIFMAQSVSINQMLDNSEQVNKPQKVVDITAVENLAELKYRKDGIIKSKSADTDKAVRMLQVPSIDTPLKVFQALESIQEKASGVTAASKGIAEEDKVGIYEGNAANTADRFGLLNKSYSFGYKRFASLYELGVKGHLNKKIAIEILGPEGIEVEEISSKDIFRKNESFGVVVEASNAELMLSSVDKKTKITFLSSNGQNPVQNPKKAYEMQALIAGFSEDDIKALMDSSDFASMDVIGEADRDIESILDGKRIQPNAIANFVYKQRFVDFMRDHEEDINEVQFMELRSYIDQLQPIIEKNIVTDLADRQLKQALEMGAQMPQPGGGPSGGPGLAQSISPGGEGAFGPGAEINQI